MQRSHLVAHATSRPHLAAAGIGVVDVVRGKCVPTVETFRQALEEMRNGKAGSSSIQAPLKSMGRDGLHGC